MCSTYSEKICQNATLFIIEKHVDDELQGNPDDLSKLQYLPIGDEDDDPQLIENLLIKESNKIDDYQKVGNEFNYVSALRDWWIKLLMFTLY